MPNGKTLGDCTGEEVNAISEAYADLTKRLAAMGAVGETRLLWPVRAAKPLAQTKDRAPSSNVLSHKIPQTRSRAPRV
jgi:hypothetical protein